VLLGVPFLLGVDTPLVDISVLLGVLELELELGPRLGPLEP
jgi:hypothetical protein